jgi:alpha-beta hydrolase superfamily lysophospholipase
MGAAVALQEMADDTRVIAAVAAESFSDLRTVAIECAPLFLTNGIVQKAFATAEEQGKFKVDEVDVVAAARRIAVPVLLIHGESDRDTTVEHSRRIFSALPEPKQLIVVPGARHNESLNATWSNVEGWIDSSVPQ